MRIRLTGAREEIEPVVAVLTDVLDVLEVSSFYPNRGSSRLGRVYLEIGGVGTQTVQTQAVRDDRSRPHTIDRPAITRRSKDDG